MRVTKLSGNGNPGALFPTQASRSAVQWHCCQGNQACWLAPSVTSAAAGAVGPAYTGELFSLAFQGKGSRLYRRGECGTLSSCLYWEAGLTAKCQVMEPGTVWRLQGQGIGSVELRVILPILLVVSCFSIWGFGEGFASHWLWYPMGVFWYLLIFLFQSS
jgi:hypothetical protein